MSIELHPCRTAPTMGTIMAVVAVLDSHMERNIVVSIVPSINLQVRYYILCE